MSRHTLGRLSGRRWLGLGELLLFGYLIAVIGVAIVRAVTGAPAVSQLASSPALLARGEWWRIFTSALVVNGPAVPQVTAIGVLGSLGIYFGGSWLFWRTAVAGHVLGTLMAYAWFGAVWMVDHAAAARLMTDPDYGVSLIWCAGLGAFAAWAWLGARLDMRHPQRPWLSVAAAAILVIVVVYSDEMAAVQHVVAFIVGLVIIATADRARRLHRQRRPLMQARR